MGGIHPMEMLIVAVMIGLPVLVIELVIWAAAGRWRRPRE